MGGRGSGNRWQSSNTLTLEEVKRIDIRYMRRRGLLRPNWTGSLNWTRNGEPCGDIGYTGYADRIVFNYRFRSGGNDWEPVEQVVYFDRTPCHIGGDRLWFRCPYPWFDEASIRTERVAKTVRLTAREKASIKGATTVLRAHVLANAAEFIADGRSPPSPIDCYCLAFGQIRPAIVVTDDIGMHLLAKTFEIRIWHGHELLKKLLSAKAINQALVQEIFEALENNGDLPRQWQCVKHTTFKKIFGPPLDP